MGCCDSNKALMILVVLICSILRTQSVLWRGNSKCSEYCGHGSAEKYHKSSLVWWCTLSVFPLSGLLNLRYLFDLIRILAGQPGNGLGSCSHGGFGSPTPSGNTDLSLEDYSFVIHPSVKVSLFFCSSITVWLHMFDSVHFLLIRVLSCLLNWIFFWEVSSRLYLLLLENVKSFKLKCNVHRQFFIIF